MLNYMEFYGDILVVKSYLRFLRKSKESKEIGPLRVGEIRRNPATIALIVFFVYVIAGSNGFERVAVLPIGLVRKALFTIPHFRHVFLNL